MAFTDVWSIFIIYCLLARGYSFPAPLPHCERSVPRSYAALGDSYASGVGAGTLPFPSYGDLACGRYSDGYPIQVANHTLLNIEESKFQNLACGGTTSGKVLRDQVPYIDQSDLVSLTVSGNEVDFAAVLNECVYHWRPDIGCEAELVKARMLIESPILLHSLASVISGAVERLKPGALLLVTGYARFFNEETDFCDHATFSRIKSTDYLTKRKRRILNQLVSLLNEVIRATAEVHGAVYVDIDLAFEGHRFCEDGVEEPDVRRSDTWFFNIPSSTEGQTLEEMLLLAQGDHPQEFDPDTRRMPEFPNIRKWRVFHPTSLGHRGISEVVVREVLRNIDAGRSCMSG